MVLCRPAYSRRLCKTTSYTVTDWIYGAWRRLVVEFYMGIRSPSAAMISLPANVRMHSAFRICGPLMTIPPRSSCTVTCQKQSNHTRGAIATCTSSKYAKRPQIHHNPAQKGIDGRPPTERDSMEGIQPGGLYSTLHDVAMTSVITFVPRELFRYM